MRGAPRKLTWWKRLPEEQEVLVRFQPEGPGTTRGVRGLIWGQVAVGSTPTFPTMVDVLVW